MAWWASSISAATKVVDVDDDKESLIDLTSDNEDAPSPAAAGAASSSSSSSGGLQVLSPWAIKMNAKEDVKSEGIKRAAEASKKAQQSGEVTVTCKPSEKIDEVVSRPAKRSKSGGGGAAGSPSSSSQEAEEDLELVGTTGTARLPHNRFACTEHKFEGPHGSSSHKEKCSLCYCYVCDRLASACVGWTDHCHATDSDPMRSSWKSLRERAKALLLAGKRPPVSGRYSSGSSSHASGGASRSSPSQPSQGGSSGGGSSGGGSSGSGSGSGSSGSGSAGSVVSPSSEARAAKAAAAAAARLPNACNCEELCKPVHDIFLPVQQPGSFTGVSPRPSAAIVYLEGLTPQQVKHVENISITSTVERAAKREVRRAGPPLSKAHYHNLIEAAEKKWRPELRVVAAGANRSDVTVVTASRDSRSLRTVFVPKWTPGAATPVAVRLGGSKSIGFEVSSSSKYGTPSSQREEYFNRFVSKKPLPPTLWFSTTRAPSDDDRVGSGALSILKVEDRYLLENLKHAYEMEFIDIKATASFDHVANTGSFSLEVVLLGKVFARGTTLTTRKGVADLVPLVERFVLDRTCKPPSRSDASVSKKKLPSWIVNGAGGGGAGSSASAPVGLGRKFTPSSKRYGGYASLDVSLAGLVDSVREEELSPVIAGRMIIHPAKMLLDLENQQHRSLPQQPDCLTVELYEHQKQDAQWMMDQEMLEGGSMQHLWAEVPLPPSAPSSVHRVNEFRRCWFSPVLNLFTLENPFTSTMKGGILCDEMGLGKTAATLCLHLIHPAKTPAPGVPLDEAEWGPIEGAQASKLSDLPGSILAGTERPGKWVSKGTLVVCKVSLVGQWVEEAKRLCGGALTIYPYHGQGRSKDPSFLAKFDVVVTTYGVVQADASRNAGYPPLRRIRWWRVVLDESHTIASTSSTTNVVKQLISNRRWCMTGTPYISRFSDVNGQLAFVGAGGQFRAQDLGDKGANFSTQAETVAFLRRVLLRHSQGMKLDGHSILGLPTITHKVEVLTMPTREREAYVDFEKGVQSDYCKVRHRLRNMAGSHTMEVLTLLSKFRQACSGGQLLIGDSAGGDGSSSSVDAFCPVCNEVLESPVKTYCGHTFCQACITSVLTKHRSDEAPCPKCKKAVRLGDLRIVGGGGGASSSAVAAGGGTSYGAKPEPYQRYGGSAGGGSSSSGSSSSSSHKPAGAGIVMETKLRALVEKIADIHRQDPTSKSLVFSQFNSSLEWLKRTLPKRGFQFRTLTGAMTRNQRTAALNAFAKDPPTTVFLLSVRSGAVGINLTQANNVFLLEPLLNLALEKQAIGRVYRLGQARPVRVTKLVLKDSIETRILDLQKKQASGGSASAAIGAPSSSGSNGVAGNIARDNAKNLKIEEYNALFGVTEG